MCLYILLRPLCIHNTTLLAGPSCLRVLAELHRIHEDASAWTPEGRGTLPFTWPDECLPHANNIRIVDTGEWCGWECRNSHTFGFGAADAAAAAAIAAAASSSSVLLGMPNAVFGAERTGVGWRDE